jgi:hypothetical protein
MILIEDYLSSSRYSKDSKAYISVLVILTKEVSVPVMAVSVALRQVIDCRELRSDTR